MMGKAALTVYLETGKRKTFAGAIDWPGWCRAGRDEGAAIDALLEYQGRYAKAMDAIGLVVPAPAVDGTVVVERLEGNKTTDFGAPAIQPTVDAEPLAPDELDRLKAILRGCWSSFTAAVEVGQGRELGKGPRGGGRDLDGIGRHVIEAHVAYLKKLGWKPESAEGEGLDERVARLTAADEAGLDAWVAGLLPKTGPRGGSRWTARYFVRRAAWHLLDHAWEIEDRIVLR